MARLNAFVSAAHDRYLPLSDDALRLAADLWARARQDGQPTADAKALDIDMIIGAQALSFGAGQADVTVTTTNTKHISLFVAAKTWNDIVV